MPPRNRTVTKVPHSPGFLSLLVVIGLTAAPTVASAGDNDLVLSRLGHFTVDGGGNRTGVVGDPQDFRSLVSELGVVLAPRLLSPSDTIGFGGFQFSFDVAYTSISEDADFWRVLDSSPNPNGTASHGNGLMSTVGLFVRKGMWLPLPSFEVGIGVVHLTNSQVWTAQGYTKFALHEGYHKFPLPSIAVRGAASRMMGGKNLDLTVASLDVSASKEFGIGGVVNLAPYAGWNVLWIIPRSEVVDKTPDVAGDTPMNFVFRDQDRILRHRFFGGLKTQYYVFEITAEASFALSGNSKDNQAGAAMACDGSTITPDCEAIDKANAQQTYSVSVGLDF